MSTNQTIASRYFAQSNTKALLFDLIAILFIYLVPTISHLLSIKLYMLEPMRLMVILAMMHTRRQNAYILALTLPLFSFVVASHPVFVKSALIGIELLSMVLVFYVLERHMHKLAAIFTSIWMSKLLYYGLKYVAIITVLPGEPLVGTSLLIQLLTSVAFSVYVFFMYKRGN